MSGGQHVCLVFLISSAAASSSVLGRLQQLLLSPLIGQRESESEREKEREGKREEWEAMDSGIAFLGRGGSKDQDFCWVSIDCPFTDLSKGGDTTLSWCPSCSNSLWQGWSCGLMHCPGGNATDPIWRVLASSQGISFWTPLKPQHSNPNPLANQLWCIYFLLLPHLSSLTDSVPFLNLLCHSKTDARFMQDGRKEVWSIPYVSVAFFPSLKQNFIAYRSSKVSLRLDPIYLTPPLGKDMTQGQFLSEV